MLETAPGMLMPAAMLDSCARVLCLPADVRNAVQVCFLLQLPQCQT